MNCALMLILLFEEIISSEVSGMEYVYVDKNMSWIEARNFCKEEFGARLSTLDQTNFGAFHESCLIGDFQDMWRNTFISSTPYLTVVGCFYIPDNKIFHNLSSPSTYECQFLCSNYSRFAIKLNKCLCLERNEKVGRQKRASLCNIPCEEGTFCGGIKDWNIYDVGEEKPVHIHDPLESQKMSCLTHQCVNSSILFRERNCFNADVSEVSCVGFSSCTFEPGEPCFLIQDKGNPVDWIVETSIKNSGPDKAYDGAYFAYIEDSGLSSNPEARLISSIFTAEYNWCLRFRYFIVSRYSPYASEVLFYNVLKRSVGNRRTLSQTDGEWKYIEFDIGMEEDFMIFFETRKQVNKNSTIAIDDVTMTQGHCNETLTTLLYMKGNLQCTFEGNRDICFVQDESDDVDWKIQEGKANSGNTGPVISTEGKYYMHIEASHNESGNRAVLISKFELNDVSINISMQYYMHGQNIGRLRLYLENDNNTKVTLLDLSSDQGSLWKNYTNITEVTTKSKVYIEAIRGEGAEGGIAIDDIQFRIINNHSIRDWKSASQKCRSIMDTYPVTIHQIENSTCWLDGPEQWMGEIKARKMYSGIDDRGRNPTSVGLLRRANNITTTIWEDLELNNSRPFACESERLNSTQKWKPYMKKGNLNFNKSLTEESIETLMVPVLIGSLFLIIAVIVGTAILYRRKKDSEKHRNNTSEELSTLANTSKHEETLSAGKKTMSPKVLEEDYDHLHDLNNTMASPQDGVYSHMLDNQYGVQEKELSNDTYDYPVGSENEYGASQRHNVNNIMTSTKDDLYNHMQDNQYGQKENFSQDTYDHTMRLESAYGAQHSNQNLNDTYDRPVLNTVDNDSS